jgi:hypothetical protein
MVLFCVCWVCYTSLCTFSGFFFVAVVPNLMVFSVFFITMLCSVFLCFRGTCCFHLQAEMATT